MESKPIVSLLLITVSAIFSAVFSVFAYYRSSSYLTECEGTEGKYIHIGGINRIDRINRINRIDRINRIMKELLFDPGRV